MCGISGVYNLNQTPVDKKVLLSMNNALSHRGPDAGNTMVWENVGLGHRRLSIIDLSEAANQPLCSIDTRYSIVYNGEVYNFLEIRKDLFSNGYKFLTNSDTEVVLAAYQEFREECFGNV